MKQGINLLFLIATLGLLACNTMDTPPLMEEEQMEEEQMEEEISDLDMAEVIKVTVSGNDKDYTFSVEIKSPDTGCDQYANWWEVITNDGQLIYRRILGHSHVDEQPFTRSGGAVTIDANQEVIVRAHMNNLGYGLKAYKGSVNDGFEAVSLEYDFALDVASEEPQPGDCAF